LGDFRLHIAQLVEAELRVGHDEDVSSLRMFVNQDATVISVFGLNLLENAFAFEHSREHVAGVGIRAIRRVDQPPEKFFCVFLRQWLGGRGRRRLKAGPPKGKRLQIFVPLMPRFLAQVLAVKAVAIAKEQGVKILPRYKRPTRQGAGFSPVLDRPLIA